MKKQKPKQYEDEPEGYYVNGTGQYQRIGGMGKSKMKHQIGFIRQVKPQPKRKK